MKQPLKQWLFRALQVGQARPVPTGAPSAPAAMKAAAALPREPRP